MHRNPLPCHWNSGGSLLLRQKDRKGYRVLSAIHGSSGDPSKKKKRVPLSERRTEVLHRVRILISNITTNPITWVMHAHWLCTCLYEHRGSQRSPVQHFSLVTTYLSLSLTICLTLSLIYYTHIYIYTHIVYIRLVHVVKKFKPNISKKRDLRSVERGNTCQNLKQMGYSR